jgi:hypothetical protein
MAANGSKHTASAIWKALTIQIDAASVEPMSRAIVGKATFTTLVPKEESSTASVMVVIAK